MASHGAGIKWGRALRKMLVANFDVCTGCRICELVCSFEKEGAFNPRYSRLRVILSDDGLFNDVIVCAQCENPVCMRVCPIEGAIYRDPDTGAVIIDQEICTGCGLCAKYCPRQMIRLDNNASKAVKCDLCGGDPACVAYCPTGALFLVEVPQSAGKP